jgi:hypothetical protein
MNCISRFLISTIDQIDAKWNLDDGDVFCTPNSVDIDELYFCVRHTSTVAFPDNCVAAAPYSFRHRQLFTLSVYV